jgi:tRNA(adenine34) deaminase
MGGVSKWNILGDTDICSAMPEVFEPPPEVVSGYMAKEAEQALIEWNPLIAGIIRRRGLFGAAPRVITKVTQPPGLRGRVLRFLRRNLFDYFGRR